MNPYQADEIIDIDQVKDYLNAMSDRNYDPYNNQIHVYKASEVLKVLDNNGMLDYSKIKGNLFATADMAFIKNSS